MHKDSKGIMEQIRDHLVQGRSSRELIDAGFAPGTVFKVQRQIRKKSHGHYEELAHVPAANLPLRSGPEDPEWWPSVDDLFEEDEPVALYALMDREFPRLSERVEVLSGSLQAGSKLVQEKLDRLAEEFGRSQQRLAQQSQTQARRIEALEQRVHGLNDVTLQMGLLLYHLDIHHRHEVHGWRFDPKDADVRLIDEVYSGLQRRLRELLDEALTCHHLRKRLNIPPRLKDLGLDQFPE